LRRSSQAGWSTVPVLFPSEQHVGLSAGLSAHSPVAAASTDGRGEKALSGIGVAECAVYENLQADGRRLCLLSRFLPHLSIHLFYLIQAHFSGQNHSLESGASRPDCSFFVMDGHLSGGVLLQLRHYLSGQKRCSQVLQEHSICAHFVEPEKIISDIGKLVFSDESIDRHIDFYVRQVSVVDGFGYGRLIEVGSEFSCPKSLAAQVNGIGTCGNGCGQGLRRSGGSKQLWHFFQFLSPAMSSIAFITLCHCGQ